MVGSDHKPIIVVIEDKRPQRRNQFRFDKRWIGRDGLMDSISSGWNVVRVQELQVLWTKL